MNYCERASANLFSLTCELLQLSKPYSNKKNKKVLDTSNINVVLDCGIKTRDGWVAGVKFIHKGTSKRAHELEEELLTHNKQAGVLIAKSF